MNYICAEQANSTSTIIIYVVLIIALVAMLIMPYFTQKKKNKEYMDMIESMKVGDLVKVKVLGVDTVKKKISLTMKTTDLPHGIAVTNQKTDRERKQGRRDAERKREDKVQSKEDMLSLLYKKFGR